MNWNVPLQRWFFVFISSVALPANAHEVLTRVRTPLTFPDIPGYITLKCDFHIHTVFSDGKVWPTVRAEEAWREGLDAIAITDHIEYQPHKADVNTNHNRAFAVAAPEGADLGVIVIHGSEITRKMPPGHLNALFLTNSTLLVTSNWLDAIQAARDQGAFIFWNHPGWGPQLTEGKIKWHPEHTQLLEAGLLHGIEVVNERDYYPEAHRWAIERNLTLFSNSDIHNPLNLDYHVHAGDHRPVTLVFARERTEAAIREALLERRTAVYSGERLFGDEKFLRPLFAASVRVANSAITLKGSRRVLLQIHNTAPVDYVLERSALPDDLTFPQRTVLAAQKIVLMEIKSRGKPGAGKRSVPLSFNVQNALTAPDTPLAVTLEVEVTFAD